MRPMRTDPPAPRTTAFNRPRAAAATLLPVLVAATDWSAESTCPIVAFVVIVDPEIEPRLERIEHPEAVDLRRREGLVVHDGQIDWLPEQGRE